MASKYCNHCFSIVILLVGSCAITSANSNSQIPNNITMTTSTPEQFISAYSHHRLSSDFMLALYQNLSKGISLNQATGRPQNWRMVKSADTIRTFPAIAAYQAKQQLVYKFNVSQLDSNERLRIVELRLRLPPFWKSRQELHALAVASDSNTLIYASTIPTATTYFASDEVTIMDITTAVRDWFEFVRANNLLNDLTLDLVFNVVSKRKPMSRNKMLRMFERRLTRENTNTAGKKFDAILVTYTQASDFFTKTNSKMNSNSQKDVRSNFTTVFNFEAEDSNGTRYNDETTRDFSPKRSKRSGSFQNNNNDLGEICHRKNMEIDFLAIGWGEWVVYPTQFNAFQCHGKCGGYADSRNNPTNHAIVQSLVRLVSSNAIPMSCCTPTKLSPLSILYLEKGEVVIKHHEEMIVDECGCL